MRRLMIVSISLLALGCGERDERGPKAAEPATPRAAPASPTPAAPAMSGYDKARRVAIGVLARPIDPSTVHRAIDDWAAADAALHRLGRDARSGEVATLLTAGAAEPARSVKGASAEQWRAIGALVIAVVLEDAARDRHADAAARLRAVATLGDDLGDTETVQAAVRACAAVASALPDDAALADACAALAKAPNATP